MAGYYDCTYMHELDDVHRLLPQEILEDNCIIDPAERRSLTVVEDTALRLAVVLSEATERTQHKAYPQPRGFDRRPVLACGGHTPRPTAPPPFSPVRAVPWQAMECSRNRSVLHPAAALPWFVPARPQGLGAQPITRRRGGGTGVFLPRADTVHHMANAARSPCNDVKPTRQCRAQKQRHGDEAAMVLQAMEQRHRYIDAQAFCQELALPLEWTY